jgi:hypothetical protein
MFLYIELLTNIVEISKDKERKGNLIVQQSGNASKIS